jgi:hypothetical protein
MCSDTGVNSAVTAGRSISPNVGIQNLFVIQVITNSVNAVSTILGLFLIEKTDRKNLLLMGAPGKLKHLLYAQGES